MQNEIVKELTGIIVLKREDGKYGIQEIIEGEKQEPSFRYRTLDLAMKIAQRMSDENDMLCAYEKSHS